MVPHGSTPTETIAPPMNQSVARLRHDLGRGVSHIRTHEDAVQTRIGERGIDIDKRIGEGVRELIELGAGRKRNAKGDSRKR